jgi:hypothetical protein
MARGVLTCLRWILIQLTLLFGFRNRLRSLFWSRGLKFDVRLDTDPVEESYAGRILDEDWFGPRGEFVRGTRTFAVCQL